MPGTDSESCLKLIAMRKSAKKTGKKSVKRLPAKVAKKTGATKRKAVTTKQKPLTTKQEVFTEKYLGNGFNAAKAAREAGYSGDDATIRSIASENLTKPNIQARIRERIDGIAATSNEVLNLLGAHLSADVADFEGCFDDEGRLDLKQAKAKGVSRLVKKIKTTTRTISRDDGAQEREVTTHLEFHDSQSAARTLVEILGLKQMPRENDEQLNHDKEMAEKVRAEIDRLVGEEKWKPADARKIVLDAHPEASKWIQ